MDSDAANHASQFAGWFLEQWEFVASVFVVMSVSVVWSLKQVFATLKTVEVCKSDVLESLNAHEEREEKRQARLEEKVDRLIDHLIDKE